MKVLKHDDDVKEKLKLLKQEKMEKKTIKLNDEDNLTKNQIMVRTTIRRVILLPDKRQKTDLLLGMQTNQSKLCLH